MSRINNVIGRVEQGEPIDLDREMTLITLEFARQGERFVDEMISLIESLDEAHRYSGIEHIELFDSGQIKAIRFRGVNSKTAEEARESRE